MVSDFPTDQTLVITTMRIAHLAEVLDLGHRVFDTAVKPYTGWSLSAAAAHIEATEPACFVALISDRVYGFVLGSMTFEQRKDWGYLEWIAVDPAMRGRGVAGRLVEACRERLISSGAAAIVTDVEASNTASATLMERNGFSVKATVNLYVHAVRPDGAPDSAVHLTATRKNAALTQAERPVR
ncbi:GNAT family N-acetyltransferase [Streptomyces sp. NPDC048560]|uniref:GNAT family N-acetyltransferase n=1 Tax=Streptomyces sp. NPDC048560 TaxID=3155488 RepID=UPI0034420353